MNMSIKQTACSLGVRAANRHGANGMTAPVDLAVSMLLPGKIMAIFTVGFLKQDVRFRRFLPVILHRAFLLGTAPTADRATA
jgi:hypothetical protein